MEKQTRRKFLKRAAVLGGAMAVSPHRVLAAGEEKAAAAPAEMAIARWAAEPAGVEAAAAEEFATGAVAAAATLTERAIEAIGGMSRFVSRGDVVWVKPNIGWNRAPELAATTNPDVVAALVRLCFDAGAKTVKVGDHTCHNAKQCYASSGIADAASAAGAKVVQLDDNRYRDVAIGGDRLPSWPIYPEIIETDLVINVPIAKHHGLSKATLCMKNYMGIIGGNRGAWHQDLPGCLCDITAFMKPRLSVLDAVRVLTDHGPQGGNPTDVRVLGTVAAGTDIVALDAFGAELLGHEPGRIGNVPAAEKRGLGIADYQSLSLREVAVS